LWNTRYHKLRKKDLILRTEDTILYAAVLMQTGVFEPVFGEGDAIISDSLNHASIIDGVLFCSGTLPLCK
jgi:glycine C-acetyltransferase